MKRSLFFGFAALLLGGISANAGTVYLDDTAGDLFAGDPTTGTFTYIGTTAAVSSTGGFQDIDFVSGSLYGIDASGNLYLINTANAAATLIGPSGVSDSHYVGLAGDSSGTLWAGGTNTIYTVNTSTGTATPVGNNTGYTYAVEGDLEFVGSTLYLTSTTDGGGDLVQVDTTTGIATDVGSTGFQDVFGLAYDTDNSVFYGYTGAGEEFDIDPADEGLDTALYTNITLQGGGTALGTTLAGGATNEIYGAAFITSTPEPGSMALLVVGLLGLGYGARRLRSC